VNKNNFTWGIRLKTRIRIRERKAALLVKWFFGGVRGGKKRVNTHVGSGEDGSVSGEKTRGYSSSLGITALNSKKRSGRNKNIHRNLVNRKRYHAKRSAMGLDKSGAGKSIVQGGN